MPASAPIEPKKLHDALVSGAPLPYPEDAVARARALAAGTDSADPGEIAGLPEPLALAVIEAAARARAIPLLAALSEAPSKPLAKAAKKALYVLRSRGVEVPERAPREPAPPAPAPAEEPLPALLSSITGAGERALVIPRPVRGAIEALQILVTDEGGAVDVRRSEMSRGSYRKMLKEVRRAGGPTAIEVPLDEAKRVLAQAAGQNLRSRTAFPEGLEGALRHLGVTPSEAPEEIPTPEEGDAGLAVGGAALHAEPEIAQWLPPEDEIRKLALKAQEVATSSLYLDEAQRAQQLKRTVESLAEASFTPEMRRIYGRRLWEMARVFDATGRAGAAALARAEARRLFHSAPGLFSPFALRLYEKVLALAARGIAARGEAPEAARPTAAEPEPPRLDSERRSPGGLILP